MVKNQGRKTVVARRSARKKIKNKGKKEAVVITPTKKNGTIIYNIQLLDFSFSAHVCCRIIVWTVATHNISP